MQPLIPIGYDSETHRIAMGNVAPPLVCGQFGFYDINTNTESSNVFSRHPDDLPNLTAAIDVMMSGQYRIVTQAGAFDMAVLAGTFPHLIPQIFKLYEQGCVEDITIREKMLNLANTGQVDFIKLPDGSSKKFEYKLFELVMYYFGIDISSTKDSPDAWRTNYKVLEHLPVSQWPPDAVKYAGDDALWPLRIWYKQEQRRQELMAQIGHDPFKSLPLRCAVAFALQLVSCWGLCTDPQAVLELEAHYRELRCLDKFPLLRDTGIIRPSMPPRPNAKGHKDHVEGCQRKWVDKATKRTMECNCPVKMVAGVEESKDTEKLKSHVAALAERDPRVKLKYTAPSANFPNGQISIDAEWLDSNAMYDPTLEQLKLRNELEKMVTTEIPRMMMKDEKGESIPGHPAPMVHPRFDVLKETGRTSSYADKIVPSIGCQNVDPRARRCYVPRPGFLFFSVDYNQMELGTLAQKCYTLFGFSKMRDLINANVDLHSWLGAQIAVEIDPQFRAYAGAAGGDRDQIAQMFLALQNGDDAQKDFFKHYRKLAKPTGLGYPGGLGPETFIAYAKADYGQRIDIETSKLLRQIWKNAYPEMPQYFKWLNDNCRDPRIPKIEMKDPQTGQMEYVDGFAYQTPFGLYRSGAVYCAAANGIGLQSPSAEGATLGLFNIVRGCYDPSLRSILADDNLGPTTRVSAFIHDENLGEVRDDELAHDRVTEIAALMEDSMRIITPDVTPRAKPCLMRRWDKDAEPVFDSRGRLVPWEPKPAKN